MVRVLVWRGGVLYVLRMMLGDCHTNARVGSYRRGQAPVPDALCVVGCVYKFIHACAYYKPMKHTSKPHARHAQARYLASMELAKSELQVAVLAEVDAQHHQTSGRLWTQAVPELRYGAATEAEDPFAVGFSRERSKHTERWQQQ